MVFVQVISSVLFLGSQELAASLRNAFAVFSSHDAVVNEPFRPGSPSRWRSRRKLILPSIAGRSHLVGLAATLRRWPKGSLATPASPSCSLVGSWHVAGSKRQSFSNVVPDCVDACGEHSAEWSTAMSRVSSFQRSVLWLALLEERFLAPSLPRLCNYRTAPSPRARFGRSFARSGLPVQVRPRAAKVFVIPANRSVRLLFCRISSRKARKVQTNSVFFADAVPGA